MKVGDNVKNYNLALEYWDSNKGKINYQTNTQQQKTKSIHSMY